MSGLPQETFGDVRWSHPGGGCAVGFSKWRRAGVGLLHTALPAVHEAAPTSGETPLCTDTSIFCRSSSKDSAFFTCSVLLKCRHKSHKPREPFAEPQVVNGGRSPLSAPRPFPLRFTDRCCLLNDRFLWSSN